MNRPVNRPDRRRCELCGRLFERPKGPLCKWCAGRDTPIIGGPSWQRWTRGLRRSCDLRLTAAGLSGSDVLAAIFSIFFDEGDLPQLAQPHAQPYLRLFCSPGRYYAAVERAAAAYEQRFSVGGAP